MRWSEAQRKPAVQAMWLRLLLIGCLAALLPANLHAQDSPAGSSGDSPPEAAGLESATTNVDDEIIYIDQQGYIRVYDPSGSPQIRWVSPTGGWSDAALGDFTGEGDEEIVAIGGEGSSSKLVIYDPVIASGNVDANQTFNGIPWTTLYQTSLPYTPRLIGTGEFDPAVRGHEIIVTYDVPSDAPGGTPQTHVTILVQTDNPPDGRAWTPLVQMINNEHWTDLAAGDLESSGIDNLALIDEDKSTLAVYRVLNGSLSQYYLDNSGSKEWNDVAIGNVDPSTPQPELVLVRRADEPLASLIVWRYEPVNKLVDVFLRPFNPSPRVVFLADISGEGDKEIFMLRNVQRTAPCPTPYTSPPLQLIMRNRGTDTPAAFEVCLDATNSFRYGAGGDLNGDGKDEVAVISANQLRIFNSPATSTSDVTSVLVFSNALTIAIGNLDRQGSAKPATLNAAPARLDFTLAAGATSDTLTIELTNKTTAAKIPLAVRTSPAADYVHWTLTASQTPAQLKVFVDAGNLLPSGVYGTNLIVESPDSKVDNVPLSIPVLANVGPGMIVRPPAFAVVQSPCTAGGTPPQVTFQVLGTASTSFTASVAPHTQQDQADALSAAAPQIDWPHTQVPWVSSAQSITNSVPATITLSLDISKARGLNQADIVVQGNVGGAIRRASTLTLACVPFAGVAAGCDEELIERNGFAAG